MHSNGLPDAEYRQQLTLLTVAGINAALIKRRLFRQFPFDHAAAIEILERAETAHRSIVALHTPQRSSE